MTSTLAAPIAPSGETTPPPEARPAHRHDIQGLRAIAVLLVMVYHAGVPGISGGFVGVDVFFVISGFLITGLIVREIERTGRLRFRRFYARRIRRLLPATAVVLAVTAVATLVALPVTRWASTVLDIIASALYVVNWRLAATSVDYLASEQASSPVQHFWSLAVEEQFYVVWPLMIALCLLVRRRFGWSLRRTLAIGLTAVAVPTLAWSVYYTATSPAPAYFVSTTRLWELAAGAFLVLVIHRCERLPRAAVWMLGWGGLAGIVASSLLLTSATPFPGTAALLPVLSTVAVLAAGAGAVGGGAQTILSWLPLRQIGDMSYSLYLWHWPFVVVGTAVFGGEDGQLWWVVGVLLVATSAVPAWFTYTVVERPIHTSAFFLRGRAVVATILVCTLIPVASAVGVQNRLGQRIAASDGGALELMGAVVLGNDPTDSPAGEPQATVGNTVPSVAAAVDDNADVYDDGCHVAQSSETPLSCTYGTEGSPIKVALVGDSHAAQWQPTLRVLAEQEGWQLDTWTKSACSFFDGVREKGNTGEPDEQCLNWNASMRQILLEQDYDLVVTSGRNRMNLVDGGTRHAVDGSSPEVSAGYARTWRALIESGAPVLVLNNTPETLIDVPECLAENPDSALECAGVRAEALETSGTAQYQAAEQAPGATLIDLNDWICPKDRCAPVIGGVIVWRDTHHLTASYAITLAPQLRRHMQRADILPSG